jgi:glycosyltransferase involved in cell wall biosynthesis
MKIAFSVITNRHDKMARFASTFSNAMVKGHEYIVSMSYEDPVMPHPIRLALPEEVGFRHIKRITNPPPFWAGHARTLGFDIVKDCDYIIMCDDDFQFTAGTKCYPFSAGKRYIDAVEYLESNPACGSVIMKNFMGGSNLGRSIIPMQNGYFETALGAVVRGKDRPYKDIIDPYFLMPGVGEDVAIFITPIMNGYYVAKARNTPTKKDVTKKVLVRVGSSSKNLCTDINYNHAWMMKHGVFSKFVEMFGEFEHGKRLPPRLIDMYRQKAKEHGHVPVY